MTDSTGRSAETTEQRVSTLVGDRLCIKCGYNLTGQPVVREPHYDMLIVRCPECAMVASLQEYPVLGRWAGRWAMVLAALWFVFVLALTFATAGMVYGSAETVAVAASESLALHLAQLQHAELEAQQAKGTLSQQMQWIVANPPGAHTPLESTWRSQQDFDAILAARGGWAAAADFSAIKNWVWVALGAFPFGCTWAVVLVHVRRRWLIAFGLIPIALAGAFVAIGHFGETDPYPGWTWIAAGQLAKRQIGLPFYIMTLAFAFMPLSLGLVLGRSIVRGLIRALLPPRLRSALASLWTADGLDPPRAAR